MNRSMISRITEAKMYQRKAIQALLPENVAGHLEVIEQELMAIFVECTKEMMNQKQKEGEEAKDNSQPQENRNGNRTKKVTID
jgi:hypothetical protein